MPSAAPTPSAASGDVPGQGSLIVKEETTTPAPKDGRAHARGPLAAAGRQAQKEEAGKTDDEGGEEGLEISSEEEDDDAVLPEAQHSEPRNEVDAKTAKFRQNAVHVYGLDFLKTGHMDEIFSQFSHKYIEWINDSSANIVFADAPSAKKALEALSFPKVGDEPWRRTPDILVSEDVPAIFLQMRFAAPTDVKKAKKSVPKVEPVVHYTRASRRQQGPSTSGGRRVLYADSQDDREAKPEARPATKRPKVVPEEELRKRQKRAQRFGESQAEAPTAAAASESAAPTAKAEAPEEAPAEKAGKRAAMPPPELTEEELAKRRKRAERFASAEAASAEDKEAAVACRGSRGGGARTLR